MIDGGQASAPVVVFDEFLVAEEWRGLLDFTLSREPAFTATQVIDNNGEGYMDQASRRSLVLWDLGWYRELFVERLLHFLPHVLIRLDHPEFAVSDVETQLTGTGNGEFFRMHTDSGSGPVATRAITFVYFFHREPRRFAGGELRIHDTELTDRGAVPAGPYQVIYPQQNQVVFFRADCLHEILPVGSPSGEFSDRRFTVNGWFRQ